MKQIFLFEDVPARVAEILDAVNRIEERLNAIGDQPTTAANIMTISQAAQYLSVTADHIYRRIKRNEIPYMRLRGSNRVRIDRAQLDKWLQSGQRVAA